MCFNKLKTILMLFRMILNCFKIETVFNIRRKQPYEILDMNLELALPATTVSV